MEPVSKVSALMKWDSKRKLRQPLRKVEYLGIYDIGGSRGILLSSSDAADLFGKSMRSLSPFTHYCFLPFQIQQNNNLSARSFLSLHKMQ